MKKTLWYINEIIFAASVILLGKFYMNDFGLLEYRVLLGIYFSTGILKFLNDHPDLFDVMDDKKNPIKEYIGNTRKDFLVSITAFVVWSFLSDSIDITTIGEAVFILAHGLFLWVFLSVIFYRADKVYGKMLYITTIIAIDLVILFLLLGEGMYFSFFLAFSVSEMVLYIWSHVRPYKT